MKSRVTLSPLSFAVTLGLPSLAVALASVAAPSLALAAPSPPDRHAAKSPTPIAKADKKIARPAPPPPPPCAKAPVDVVSGADADRFVLTQCDGTPAPTAVEHLSIVARPGGVPKPALPFAQLAKQPGPSVAPGIKRVDAGLLTRLQKAVDHFAKPGAGQPARILLVSGYRPTSAGSYHQAAKALDFRIEGVANEALVAFCKTLDDTGCGYYPNSVFIHMDVRAGAGHVSWIDASGPGESPRYVTTWPPRPRSVPANGAEPDRAHAKSTALSKLERDLPTLPAPDEHPAHAGEATPTRDPNPDTIPAAKVADDQ